MNAIATEKTYAGWTNSGLSLSQYLRPGDDIDEDLADYFRDVLPPTTHTASLIQIGEPFDFAGCRETYQTIQFTTTGWVYRGTCWRGQTIHRIRMDGR